MKANVDAPPLHYPVAKFRQFIGKDWQYPAATMQQYDIYFRGVDMAVALGSFPGERIDLGSYLNSRVTTARNHEGQQFLLLCGIGFNLNTPK